MRSTNYVPRSMDRRITIERGTPSRNSSGGEVLTWASLATRWAAVTFEAGSENTSAKKETASQVTVFRTRYITGLTEKDRISYDGACYDITQIQEQGRRHYHTIYTEYRR